MQLQYVLTNATICLCLNVRNSETTQKWFTVDSTQKAEHSEIGAVRQSIDWL